MSSSLIFNHITLPVGRAGGADLMLPVLVIALVSLVQTFSLPAAKGILLGAFIALCVLVLARSYLTTVARMNFSDDRMQVLLAVHKREIPYSAFKYVEIARHSFTPVLLVKIRVKTFGSGILLTVRGPECRDPEQTWGHLSYGTLERSQIFPKPWKPLTKEISQLTVEDRAANLKQLVSPLRGPAHGLLLAHSLIN